MFSTVSFNSGSRTTDGGTVLTVGINLGFASVSTGTLCFSDFTVAAKLLLLSKAFFYFFFPFWVAFPCNGLPDTRRALESPTLGVFAGVNPTKVQWKGLSLVVPPSFFLFSFYKIFIYMSTLQQSCFVKKKDV